MDAKMIDPDAERSFHESTRKEQELQKLKKQVSEIEEYVKTIAKPPPLENIYSPFPISPQRLLTNTVIQHPVKPPFLPPNLPEQTTIFGRKNKEKVVAISHITPQEETAPEEKPLPQLMVTLKEEDAESLYSEQEYPDTKTVFGIDVSGDDSSGDEGPDESSDDEEDCQHHFPILSFDEITKVEEQSLISRPPVPNIEVHILPAKYEIPIKAIAFIDTGASRTMMNPKIIHLEFWEQKEFQFKATSGEVFTTELMTKKNIKINFFPNCTIYTKVIGTDLSEKDILIGMDVYTQIRGMKLLPNRIRYKSHFKPFSPLMRIFSLSETPPEYEEFKEKLLKMCVDSHDLFRHPKPL